MADDNVVPLPSTVKFPHAFRTSPSAGFDGALHWEFWRYAINRRCIEPMDLDAIVEINNFFLINESKNPGVPISSGQQRTLNALLRTGLCTVIYQTGKEWPQFWSYQTIAHPRTPEFADGLNPDRRSGSIFDFIRAWSIKNDTRHPEAWRFRMIDAALHGASNLVWQHLADRLAQNGLERLAAFADLPLWRATIDRIKRQFRL
jgi:hypothetical protein